MRTFVVDTNQPLSPSSLLLTLRPVAGQKPILFRPGQYAAISFRRGGRPTVVRCFSIVSSPLQPDHLQFAVKVNGAYTQAVADLQPGDEVRLLGAFGAFVVEPRRYQRLVFMAGGIGITPFMSMLRTVDAQRSTMPITLVYSCANSQDVPFWDELQAIASRNANVRIMLNTSGSAALKSRLNAEFIAAVTAGSVAGTGFYLCGPAGFMKAMSEQTQALGVPLSHIHSEAFSQITGGAIAGALPRRIYRMSALVLVAVVMLVTFGDLKHVADALADKSQAATVVASDGDSDQDDTATPTATPDPTPAPTPTPMITPASTAAARAVVSTPKPTVAPTTVPTVAPTPVTVYRPPVTRSS